MVERVETSLFGFPGESVRVTGRVELQMTPGEGHLRQLRTINFMLVDAPSQYNVMLGRLAINAYTAIIFAWRPEDTMGCDLMQSR